MITLPWYAEWEAEAEAAGPLVEAYCPMGRLPDGRGFWEAPVPHEWREVHGHPWLRFPYVGAAVEAWAGKRRVVDMGADPPSGRCVPDSLPWSVAIGRDMRDVADLGEAAFDLVFSSHAIEHVPAEDVPRMFEAWMRLLAPGGEIFVAGPHRCSARWSPVLNPAVRAEHFWAPAAAAVGNLLVGLGLELVGADTCVLPLHMWWVRLRRAAA